VPFVGFAREKASVPDVARVLAAAREPWLLISRTL